MDGAAEVYKHHELKNLGDLEETAKIRCRRHKRCRFNSWKEKMPWSRKWQLAPVILPAKFHGQGSLTGYSTWGHKESDMT